MDNLEIYNKVREVPEEAKKTIQAGRMKGFTDINPMWRIKTLTEQFGPCGFGWYFTVLNRWAERESGEVAAFVDIEMYVKHGYEWSKPIYGVGGSKLATKEKSGTYVSDECYKMATTDAISVCCKHLGIGADVYYSNDKTKYGENRSSGHPEDRKINQSEIGLLSQASERTGMNLDAAMKRHNLKSASEIPLSLYTDWMVKLANADSRIPRCSDNGSPDIPSGIDEEVPFK